MGGMKKSLVISLVVLLFLNSSQAAPVNVYDKHVVSGWVVYVDSDLAKSNPDLEKKALPRLESSLLVVKKKLPKLFLDTTLHQEISLYPHTLEALI